MLQCTVRKHKIRVNVPYIIGVVFLLHVLATLVAIFTEMHYQGWIYLNITNVCGTMHRCKIPSFKSICFKIHINYQIEIKIFVFNLSV